MAKENSTHTHVCISRLTTKEATKPQTKHAGTMMLLAAHQISYSRMYLKVYAAWSRETSRCESRISSTFLYLLPHSQA